MFDFARTALVWLHRTWSVRLLAGVVLPVVFMLLHFDVLTLPVWAELVLFAAVGAPLLAAWLMESLYRSRPRRDRSRPILEQIMDDGREDVALEERMGLKRIPQAPPPDWLLPVFNLLGKPHAALDHTARILLVVAFGALLSRYWGMELDALLKPALSAIGLAPVSDSALTFWLGMVVTVCFVRLGIVQMWRELSGEVSPDPLLTSYGRPS